ncbi:Mannosylfructose-phosphate synthase [Novipirellula galeiformis]|uniref:Mannosylfructose-phosphate synthase n=1 Tax=Novipirellula galeiformis TaxID=2528004 RepID=A0A5C6C1P0_9BACT|nr:glycosyltransferase family 4 protein [Novipirellula galeiformis]TWU17541.1 Mannosylfructose-phosphate synthase [Novipirellula galeiformis]
MLGWHPFESEPSNGLRFNRTPLHDPYQANMKVVFLTAGAAGMYCGSCMHDNATARVLQASGIDCILQPIYTPIRTDEPSIAQEQIFFGGIHIYLLQQLPWTRFFPKSIRRLLDWPPLIQMATRRAMSTDAAKLGALAISMLKGTEGRQAEEVQRLTTWLESEMQPDVLVLSNLLIGGALPTIRQRLPNTKIVVLLQGDDIFLDHLPAEARAQAIELCAKLVDSVDQFIVNSRFYADKMGSLLSIPERKLTTIPLSIDLHPFAPRESSTENVERIRLGYLARIAPEKGLHRLVDAFIELAHQPPHANLTLEVAGWLGEANRPYLDSIQQRIDKANLRHRFTYHGSPSLDEKSQFLRSLDLLCVPTEYEDPKGLFALEAIASGVPVVLPDHGAFGELIASTAGGVLVPANDHHALSDGIGRLARDHELRHHLARTGRINVQQTHSIETTAERLVLLFNELTSTA